MVIPAKDEPDLVTALRSLRECRAPQGAVEVVVVINGSERDDAATRVANQRCARETRAWAADHSTADRRFHVLELPGLPAKRAGVGLARKIGMDEACRRLDAVGRPHGVIACFDADSRCDANYLVEVEKLFATEEPAEACSIYFEHPLEGTEHDAEVYAAILRYELHLRYYRQAQRHAGLPFAIHTIGSAMAVRCDAYQAQNGMNQRQAGEDFYFLHKYTPLGRVAELTSTRVMPSPRASRRVPFGTGRAVERILASGEPFRTYAPESFEELRRFTALVPKFAEVSGELGWRELPPGIRSFLNEDAFRDRIDEIRCNVRDAGAFQARFFRWWNAFQVLKYLHHARDRFFPDVEVGEAAVWLMGVLGGRVEAERPEDLRGLLDRLRCLDRYGKVDGNGP